MTMMALVPIIFAAAATAWAWLPDEIGDDAARQFGGLSGG